MAEALLVMVIIPLAILAHELGHALVALRITAGPVNVVVGRQPGLVRLRVGRLGVSLHIDPAGGVCVWKPSARPHDDLLILAGGPIASLLWAGACAAALIVWGQQLHLMGLIGLGFGVVEGVGTFVYSAAAALMPSLRSARPRSDGAQFQRALRANRAPRKLEAELGRPVTQHDIEQIIATKRPPSEVRRARTSVAPPSIPSEPPR